MSSDESGVEQRLSEVINKRMYKSTVESLILCGTEVCGVSKVNNRKLLTTEMDCWRHSLGISKGTGM